MEILTEAEKVLQDEMKRETKKEEDLTNQKNLINLDIWPKIFRIFFSQTEHQTSLQKAPINEKRNNHNKNHYYGYKTKGI